MDKYMKYFNTAFVLFWILLIFAISSCEPGGRLIINNQQNKDVILYFANVSSDGTIDKLTKQGVISANSTKTFGITFLGSTWVNRIELQDLNGDIIFSHDYLMADLEKIGWKITIPP